MHEVERPLELPEKSEEKPAFRYRLATRHALFTVLIALVVGFTSSIVELIFNLRDERLREDETVRLIADIAKEPAGAALFAFDRVLAQRVAEAIAAHRGLLAVDITDDSNKPLVSVRRPPADRRLQHLADYLLGPAAVVDVALSYRSVMLGEIPVGNLRIESDGGIVLSNLQKNLARLVLSSMIHAVVLATAIAGLFHILTTTPMLRLARRFADVEPDKPIRQLVAVPRWHDKDELGAIVRVVNRLIMAFQTSLTERDRIGEELRLSADDLEQRVEARTLEVVEQSQILQTSIEAMAEGILVVDPQLHLILWNSQFLEIFQLPVDLVTPGMPVEVVIRYLIARGEFSLSGSADGNTLERWLDDLQRPDFDPARWNGRNGAVIEVRRNRLANGGIVSTYTDMTRQAAFEDELRRAKELAEATLQELRQAQLSLVQAEKMASLGNLVAGVAHELNTPLGNMRMVSTTLEAQVGEFGRKAHAGPLQRSVFDKFLEDGLAAARLLARESEHAAELVGNFKQIAIDQSSLRRRSFDFATIVRETLSSLQNKLKNSGISVEQDIPDGIVMDNHPGPIEQILANFVLNSLLHAFDPGRTGTIRITARRDDDLLHLTYADDGRGMPADIAKRAFDPFFTTKFGQGGSGLGLYIVYNLATGVLNGTLDLTTQPEAGTRFDLRFPLNAPASEAAL